jgi:hypothetical protein
MPIAWQVSGHHREGLRRQMATDTTPKSASMRTAHSTLRTIETLGNSQKINKSVTRDPSLISAHCARISENIDARKSILTRAGVPSMAPKFTVLE